MAATDRITADKEHELENMRKARKDQKDFFKKLESGEVFADNAEKKEPKLLIGRISKDGKEAVWEENMFKLISGGSMCSFTGERGRLERRRTRDGLAL